PFPFEIIQTPKLIVFSYEFAHARRNVFTDGSSHPSGFPDFWMGDSRGRWEGDTLGVVVTNSVNATCSVQAENFPCEPRQVENRTVRNIRRCGRGSYDHDARPGKRPGEGGTEVRCAAHRRWSSRYAGRLGASWRRPSRIECSELTARRLREHRPTLPDRLQHR